MIVTTGKGLREARIAGAHHSLHRSARSKIVRAGLDLLGNLRQGTAEDPKHTSIVTGRSGD